MRIARTQNRIRELIARFVVEVQGATAQGDTYVNHLSETVLVPLLREVYGFENLRNLNHTERYNFPAIDLADEELGLAIQVTATSDSEKIKETLRKFVAHQLHEDFNRLIVYILSEKQQSYSGRGFDDIIGGQFVFDKDRDILDYRDILHEVNSFDLARALRVEKLLEEHFSDERDVLSKYAVTKQTESVFLNLIELLLPAELYLASIAVNRSAVIKASNGGRLRLTKNASTRELVRAALEQAGLGFGVDWIDYEGKIVTFHDLSEPHMPLCEVIDPGTVEIFEPSEFYNINQDYENVFKTLLWRSLQQMLFHMSVQWQNQESLFIFVPINAEETRIETWQGKSKGERVVYKRVMKSNKPDEVLRHEHFGFRTQFMRFGHDWYMVIKPEWFASYDGYHKDTFGNFTEYKKRQEKNPHVSSHTRFIAHFLKSDPSYRPPDLFSTQSPKVPFLRFGEFVHFDDAPFLNDAAYLPPKETWQEEVADGIEQMSFLEEL